MQIKKIIKLHYLVVIKKYSILSLDVKLLSKKSTHLKHRRADLFTKIQDKLKIDWENITLPPSKLFALDLLWYIFSEPH